MRNVYLLIPNNESGEFEGKDFSGIALTSEKEADMVKGMVDYKYPLFKFKKIAVFDFAAEAYEAIGEILDNRKTKISRALKQAEVIELLTEAIKNNTGGIRDCIKSLIDTTIDQE